MNTPFNPAPGLRRRALLGRAALGAAAAAGAACSSVAPPPPQPTPRAGLLRLAITSCCDQTQPQPLWDALLAQAPDHVLFGGDNVYASRQPFDIAELRAAYAQQARVPGFARVRAALPHSAIWDDHDYGLNDGGADFAQQQASKDAFCDFWAVPAGDERRQRGGLHHTRWLQAGGRRVQLIVLDTRWWRSPLKPTDQRGARGRERWLPDDDASKTLLGAEQWAWLEARLHEPADAHVVYSSIQLLAEGHGFERWGNLPRERARFFSTLRATTQKPVVLASGDRHIGALYHHAGTEAGQPLWEITSSGVTHPWATADEPGPNRLGPLVRERHWGVVEFDFPHNELTLELCGIDGKVLHAHTVPLSTAIAS